ncbi:MAG: DUF4159 domain-containing protein [Candidatus Binatia bacterium]|nr:DUF4159 domain-containing protein [Candidatus Binatia bacterium]
MNRREFIAFLTRNLLMASGLIPRSVIADNHETPMQRHLELFFAQLRYRGGDWLPRPFAVRPLMEEVMRRTSIEADTNRRVVTLTDPNLFAHPFLYMAGKFEFEPFSKEEAENLRRFLSFGGLLLVDNALGQQGYGFDKSIRREMKKVFPDKELKRLPSSHAALRSYYLLKRIGGRKIVDSFLEGINVGDVTPVIYCHNDLGGAWERDQLGNWVYSCSPGGEEQRKDAFHLGINLILYAMTGNYKEDLIHVPFIRKRLTLG